MLFFDVCLLSKFTALLLATLQLETTGKPPKGKEIPGLWRGGMPGTAAFTTARLQAHILVLVMTTAKWPLVAGGKGDKMDRAKGTYHLSFVMLSALRMSFYLLTERLALQGRKTCAQSLPAAPRGVGCWSKVITNHLNPLPVRDSTLRECRADQRAFLALPHLS